MSVFLMLVCRSKCHERVRSKYASLLSACCYT